MELIYLQFSSVLHLKKFREALPPRRVVILLPGNILLSEFTEKELELAETVGAILLNAKMSTGI